MTTTCPPQFSLPRLDSRNASIFQPPKSPASTTTSPSFATDNDYFSPQSRKRARPDSSHSHDEPAHTPWTATSSYVQCPTPSDGMYGSACAQSSAPVNERYRLAGGFDTPGLMATTEQEPFGRGDWEFRRGVRDMDPSSRHEEDLIRGPLARERNGVARMYSSPNGAQAPGGWTSFAFGLVGKVFSLSSTVIRGFYAGDGKGYDLHQQTSRSDGWMDAPARHGRGSTPVPGAWQDDEFLGDFEQDNPNSPSVSDVRPSNKRRQTDKDSWVMVGTPEIADLSPKRKPSSNSSIPRSSLASKPAASRASSRRSLAPVSRRQSSHVSHTGSPAQHVPPPHLQMASERRASFAPIRSPISRPSSARGPGTYVSPEAERFVKRQAKQDKAADKAMSSMSRRLDDLIRQGQQALGTKVSVEGGGGGSDDAMDEGFVDEEWE